MLNHTNKHPWYRKMFCFLFLAPYARTTRYEEAFCLKAKNDLIIVVKTGLKKFKCLSLFSSKMEDNTHTSKQAYVVNPTRAKPRTNHTKPNDRNQPDSTKQRYPVVLPTSLAKEGCKPEPLCVPILYAYQTKHLFYRPYPAAKHVIPPSCYELLHTCLLYTSPSPRDRQKSRMPSSA